MPIKNLVFNNIDLLLMVYIFLARILELLISKKNTKKLIQKGAKEYFPFHYNFIVLFHCILIIYFFIKCFENDTINLFYFIIFVFLQFARFKVLNDLGQYWTTRIIVLDSKKLIKTGMYKYFNHPNYLVVLLEVISLCLLFNDYNALLFFTLVKVVLLFIRIYYEEEANKKRF